MEGAESARGPDGGAGSMRRRNGHAWGGVEDGHRPSGVEEAHRPGDAGRRPPSDPGRGESPSLPGRGEDSSLPSASEDKPSQGNPVIAYLRANPQALVLLVVCVVLGIGTFLAVIVALITDPNGQTTGEPNDVIFGAHALISTGRLLIP